MMIIPTWINNAIATSPLALFDASLIFWYKSELYPIICNFMPTGRGRWGCGCGWEWGWYKKKRVIDKIWVSEKDQNDDMKEDEGIDTRKGSWWQLHVILTSP